MRKRLRNRRPTGESCRTARRCFQALFALGGSAVALARAPAQATNDHWAVIDRGLAEIGGPTHIDRATSAQAGLLTLHLLERGQFYLDLYEYERVIVRTHAQQRDSIEKAGGVAVPEAAYFLGRALQELDKPAEAQAAYRRALSPQSPDAIRPLATAWLATLTPGGAPSWQQDVVDWRRGKRPTSTSCPAGAVNWCTLFRAIVRDDVPAIVAQSQSLAEAARPDFVHHAQVGGESFEIDFYDPLRLYLLAAADFTLAAHIAARSPALDVHRGLALLRSGRSADAVPVLKAAQQGPYAMAANAYLGEALVRQGHPADADKLWRTVTGPSAAVVLDEKSTMGADADAALQAYRADSIAGLQHLNGKPDAVYLGRALLRLDHPSQALAVLDGFRPASVGTDLNQVKPDVLVLLSRANYLAGLNKERTLFETARGDIAPLAKQLPVIRPLLQLLQEVTIPTNVPRIRPGRARSPEDD